MTSHSPFIPICRWPYSWSKCYPDNPSGFTGYDYLKGSRYNPCSSNPPYGFTPGVARTFPEIDIFEVKIVSTGANSPIDARAVASLQLAPIMAEGLSFSDNVTSQYVCFNSSQPHNYYNEFCYRPWSGPSDGGPGFCTCPLTPNEPRSNCYTEPGDASSGYGNNRGGNVVQDALSGKFIMNQTHFDEFHTYGLYWQPNSSPDAHDGYMRFYVDDEPWYEIQDKVLQERRDANGNILAYERTIPYEPMYIIMNLAASNQWTWIDPALPATFPVDMVIDYVRVYQTAGSNHTETLSCDPPSMPTSQFIACNPWK